MSDDADRDEGRTALKRALVRAKPEDSYLARQYVRELEDDVEDVAKALVAYFEMGYELGVAAGCQSFSEEG